MSQDSHTISLLVCNGRKCRERQSEYILKRLENDAKKHAIEGVTLDSTLCRGRCQQGPILVEQYEENALEHIYSNPIKASAIFKHIITQLSQKKGK